MRPMLALTLVLVGFGLGRLSNLPSAAAQASDQEQPIMMGPATLRLGMAKDRVLSQFGPEYRLNDYGNSFLIFRRPLRPDGDFTLLGNIAFEGVKVVSVSKSWVSNHDDIDSFFRGLYGSIASAIGSQRTTAVVSTITAQSQPDFTEGDIVVVLKGRTITISRKEFASEKLLQYSVDERFGK